MKKYYLVWFKRAVWPAYSIAGKVSWVALALLAGLTSLIPLPESIEVDNWLVSLGAFVVLFTWGALRAPYLMDKEKQDAIADLRTRLERREKKLAASKELTSLIDQYNQAQNRPVAAGDVSAENALLEWCKSLDSYTCQHLSNLLPEWSEEFKTLQSEHPIQNGERKFEHAKRVILEKIKKLRAFQRRISDSGEK